ncbi:hypothetical protein ZHAS_00003382 [Anopheles sinensis]|uniref:TED_complement domain-containing protein n=1 Tax=Anopheles sinensis TaxID=74873 RepID=A0A084VE71_ANOSI|nr:hypothetical protein ZHAS_00003382 [Anopheles sinensis]
MVKFVPNIVVLDYLTAIGSKETNVMNIATKHLRTGYQNQMRYRQTDGSFGVWSSGGGSVFLTAFVAKAIQTASKYISEVDVTMVSSAFQWLANKQQSSGRFDEVGPVYNNTMQGGLQTNTNGIALTSYVLIAFLENENAKITHAPVVERSIQYVAGLLPQVTDLYDLSIATYAMLLGDHHSKQHFIRRLMDKSTFSEYDTMRYWHRYPHSIETTGYALLAMVQGEKYPDSILVMRWLVKQGYVTGSIPRTQDTFVGLKALTKLAEVISPSRNNYFIQLKYKTQTKNFFVTSKDIGQLIFQDIPGDIEKLDISVAGLGFGLLNVKHQYAMDLRNYKHRFDLTLEKLNTSLDYELKLKICVSFIPNLIYERSNMALVEVNFPSGYVVDPRPITEATMVNPIQVSS